MQSKWWVTSPTFDGTGAPLRLPSISVSNDRELKSAQKLTVDFVGAFVKDSMDTFSRSNDVVIASRFAMDDRPMVTRLHYYERDVSAGTWVGPFFNPVIAAFNDFSASAQEFTLQLMIYDEDGLSDTESKELTEAFQSVASAASIAFPAYAPYAGLGAGLGTAIAGLADNLNRHDRILDAKIRLAINAPENAGMSLLQPGYFICFSAEINATNLYLGQDLRVYYWDGQGQPQQYKHASYAILHVSRRFLLAPEYIIDQNAATLLSEIQSGKGQAGTRALYFLKDTIKQYTNFKRLQRYYDLKGKATRSAEEESLMNELKADPSISQYAS